MAERLGDWGGYHDDDDYYDDVHEDLDGVDDDTTADILQGRDGPVEHQVDHAVDDAIQLHLEEQMEWRVRARRRRNGGSFPPRMTGYRWPVFVRVADLPNRDEDGDPDDVDPID